MKYFFTGQVFPLATGQEPVAAQGAQAASALGAVFFWAPFLKSVA
jgi:hypothetical protein